MSPDKSIRDATVIFYQMLQRVRRYPNILEHQPSIAVVMPAYRVASLITEVIARIPPEVGYIIVVDDASPDNLRRHLLEIPDPRLIVLCHKANRGVGGGENCFYGTRA